MIIGTKIIYIEELSSTNTYAIRMLAAGKPAEGTMIRTDFQSSGRGQPGNTWESEKGKNLLFSIILYPEMTGAGEQFLVSMALSLGLVDFAGRYAKDSSIKWPNDIYVKDAKLAGILIESATIGDRIKYMVAGIGLNINQEKFNGPASNPVSLKKITGQDHDLEKCLYELSHDLDSRYRMIREGKKENVIEEYHSHLFRKNQWAIFSDKTGSFEGRIKKVSSDGMLTMEKRSGESAGYYFREVDFIF